MYICRHVNKHSYVYQSLKNAKNVFSVGDTLHWDDGGMIAFGKNFIGEVTYGAQVIAK